MAYGFSGYGTPSYRHAIANIGVDYGGYSTGFGGYGGYNNGYSGPTEPYGNSSATNTDYVSGPPSAPKSPWTNQGSYGRTIYASASFGVNASYGIVVFWNTIGVGDSTAGTEGSGTCFKCDGHEGKSQYGKIIESKIISDRENGRSRGFGFVTFRDEQSMRDAIERMNGQDLDGRNITVNKVQTRGGGGGGGGGYCSGDGGSYGGGGGGYGRREGNSYGGSCSRLLFSV
ncbi:hypothetical protein NE237_031892 [Protea cynaroides]|uniref:RRM domain-containing protein n=1 Tax=Protea cynaroides TaxID=273540 RepID=A0A9Q0R2J8_9MAGN|nr:hypothetical protein NE237_031892 [Protea cynaroides]